MMDRLHIELYELGREAEKLLSVEIPNAREAAAQCRLANLMQLSAEYMHDVHRFERRLAEVGKRQADIICTLEMRGEIFYGE